MINIMFLAIDIHLCDTKWNPDCVCEWNTFH